MVYTLNHSHDISNRPAILDFHSMIYRYSVKSYDITCVIVLIANYSHDVVYTLQCNSYNAVYCKFHLKWHIQRHLHYNADNGILSPDNMMKEKLICHYC